MSTYYIIYYFSWLYSQLVESYLNVTAIIISLFIILTYYKKSRNIILFFLFNRKIFEMSYGVLCFFNIV